MQKEILETHFGQSGVFDLNNDEVDPKVVEYLESVRNEALTITAIGTDVKNVRSSERQILGDIESSIPTKLLTAPDHIVDFLDRLPLIQLWYDESREELLNENVKEPESSEDEDEGEINAANNLSSKEEIDYNAILLQKLDEYFQKQNYKPWMDRVQPLIQAAKDKANAQNQAEPLELDDQWAREFATWLIQQSFTSYQGIKQCLQGYQDLQTKEPCNFAEWVTYVERNLEKEPPFEIPVGIEFALLSYVCKNHLNKDYSKVVTKILLTLPSKLLSTQISVLRDLGKLSALYLYNIGSLHTSKTLRTIVVDDESSGIIPFNVAELVLTVLSEHYGQKDLIEW
ncbi:hypothetical protein ACO0QE_003294 [Hanseniaspora vineae]